MIDRIDEEYRENANTGIAVSENRQHWRNSQKMCVKKQ